MEDMFNLSLGITFIIVYIPIIYLYPANSF